MKYTSTVIALFILIIGFGAGYVIRGDRTPGVGSHVMSDGDVMSNNEMAMGNAMGDMMAGLSGKSGDQFDQAFLSGMILHHEGAVEMARAALVSARHQEIKDMAKAIITAQTSEINQMKAWSKSWYNQ